MIADVSYALGVGSAGLFIGMITALAESDLWNYWAPAAPYTIPWGDKAPPGQYAPSTKNSGGLFQQRPQWWGGPGTERERYARIMDPAQSAGMFFRALLEVPRWQKLNPWEAAQAVQGSEYADGSNYRARQDQARQWLARIS